ncbi:MAG: alpha/beta hydrolase [Crocinitomicaceae bacterium]|nr:alpha/beta hydrolase [Crocinitomicaceae bacterium]
MAFTIYCLGGLFKDDQIFQNLHPEGVELVHIKYNTPLKDESLSHYSKRLFEKLQLPEKYQLLGVSFGGMIATEFSKIRTPEKLYLVSSVSQTTEIPLKFKIALFLRLHKIIPNAIVRHENFISRCIAGIKKKNDQERMTRLLSNADAEFLKWGLDSFFRWKNTLIPKAIRIHGTKDRIFPYTGNVDHPIQDGSHFIMTNRSDEIAKILSSHNRH